MAKTEKALGVSPADPYIVSVAYSVNDTVDIVVAGSVTRFVGGKLKADKTDKEQDLFVTQDGATVRCA